MYTYQSDTQYYPRKLKVKRGNGIDAIRFIRAIIIALKLKNKKFFVLFFID